MQDKDNHAKEFMRRAVELARRGAGFVSPNPLVGALVVRDGEVIGEGWHERYGEAHAERNAIADAVRRAGGDASVTCGADMFVTLEPCCHTGRQPPCTEAIIAAGIRCVHTGSADPNPLVAGKGVAALRSHGIAVHEGVLREECDALNPVFFHYITTGMPYITLKYAMTANGVASVSADCAAEYGAVSGEEAHSAVHRSRADSMAIMAGIATVKADDPLLTCRIGARAVRQPVRVILDPRMHIPAQSRLLRSVGEAPLWIVCAPACAGSRKARLLQDMGARVVPLPLDKAGRIDLARLSAFLGAEGIDSVLLESAGRLAESALRAGIVQKVQVYIAPMFYGAAVRRKSNAGMSASALPFAAALGSPSDVRRVGDDILIEYDLLSQHNAQKA